MINSFENIKRKIRNVTRLDAKLRRKTSDLLELSGSDFNSKMKMGANALKQRVEKGNLDPEQFKHLLIYKLIPYCGANTITVANDLNIKNYLRQGVCTVFGLKVDSEGNPQIDKPQILYEAYRKIKSYFKLPLETNVFNSEKEGLTVRLPDTWKEFKAYVTTNMTTAEKIVKEFGDAGVKKRERFFKDKWLELGSEADEGIDYKREEIESAALENDWVLTDVQKLRNSISEMGAYYPLTEVDRTTFYMIKLFKSKRVPVLDDTKFGEAVKSINKLYSIYKILRENSDIIKRFESLNPGDDFLSRTAKDKFTQKVDELKSNRDNISKGVEGTDTAKTTRNRRGFDLSLDSNSPKNIATRWRRSHSDGSRKRKTSSRPRSASLLLGLKRRYKQQEAAVFEYVGEMLTRLYTLKPNILCDEAQKIASGDYASFEEFIALLKSHKTITIISDTGISYNVPFPSDFENFKNTLLTAKNKANSLKREIDTKGKEIRDKWLEGLCKPHNLDANDVRIKIIYAKAIADDPTITTTKRLATIIRGMDEAIKDASNSYKNAFFILKLFANGTVKQSEIPRGTGLGNILSAFYMLAEIGKMLKTIDTTYYLNEKTRNKIEKEIEKLGPTTNIPTPTVDSNEIGSKKTEQHEPKGQLSEVEQKRFDELNAKPRFMLTKSQLDELAKLQKKLKSNTTFAPPSHLPPEAIRMPGNQTDKTPASPSNAQVKAGRPLPKPPVRKPSGRPLPPTPNKKPLGNMRNNRVNTQSPLRANPEK